MANLYGKKAKAPAFMPVDGCGIQIVDSITLAVNPTAADVINFRLPAGIYLGNLKIRSDDLDTNVTPTIVFSVGYRPADSTSSLSPSAAYFAAAGQTTAQGGGTLDCSFEPIKFEEDVYITVTVATASATFAAGDVFMIANGAAEGPK
ncbi:MAG: hypothetical protein A3E79_00200 [Burkholderiales bacterium RIFCSPHIGHO2_12_FULL_61_11]|nr:MAG: hypothetical protein A3E79_00200 [Burkholderiales bacterium RIFCSPHIGHO2_12_FULL_61_11]